MAPYFSRTTCRMSDMFSYDICEDEYRHLRPAVLHLSRRIYERAPGGDGVAFQGAGRCHPAADSGPPPDRRSLCLRHPREPEDPAVEGLASPGLPPPHRPGRDAA